MSADYDPQKFYDGLVKHRLIIPVGVQGAFGRGAVFEDVLERFNGQVSALSKHDGAEIYTFPPIISRHVTMPNWVYRHETSPEPTRMQSFRVREFVRVGTADEVVEWRDMWLERGVNLLTSLGLPARADVAADPFFGRGGKMLAVSQKE